jgi:hypothetical protein
LPRSLELRDHAGIQAEEFGEQWQIDEERRAIPAARRSFDAKGNVNGTAIIRETVSVDAANR